MEIGIFPWFFGGGGGIFLWFLLGGDCDISVIVWGGWWGKETRIFP